MSTTPASKQIAMTSGPAKTALLKRQATPDRPVAERVEDFQPTTATPNLLVLFGEEASRCCKCSGRTRGCGQGEQPELVDAPGCPLNTRIPDWLKEVSNISVVRQLEQIFKDQDAGKLTQPQLDTAIDQLLGDQEARRHLRTAFDLAMERNVLSEILGAVCPQAEELCESGTSRPDANASCVSGAAGFQPIAIGNIENLIGRIGRRAGWLGEMMDVPLLNPEGGKDKHISIVGGGPAGMASAMMLRRLGYRVSVYFREKHVGGLLMYGLPGTKLDKQVVLGFEKILVNTPGITLHSSTNIAKDEMAHIQNESDAVILALGAQSQNALKMDGQHGAHGQPVTGYINSLEFISDSVRKYNLGETDTNPEHDAKGKGVVVIGGGDTAMDCVREAVRQGAARIRILYRGTAEQMRAVEKEVKRAKLEHVEFELMQAPTRIISNEFGHVSGIVCTNGKNGAMVEITHKAQLIINATGFTAEPNLTRKLGISGLMQDEKTRAIMVKDPRDSMRVLIQTAVGNSDNDAPDPQFSRTIFAAGDLKNIGPKGRCLAVNAVLDATVLVAQIHRRYTSPSPM